MGQMCDFIIINVNFQTKDKGNGIDNSSDVESSHPVNAEYTLYANFILYVL
jgi:hypothetical protein